MQICIIDYGVGNINSIYSQIKKKFPNVIISNSLEKISSSDKIILPGVGSANFAMKKIKDLKLDKILYEEIILKKKPILGICLGMQMLFENLYEDGLSKGLNFQRGEVKKLNQTFSSITIPNIGWAKVKFNNSKINEFIGKFNNFYFSHSYYVETIKEDYLAFIENTSIPAATLTNNIVGVQFHPEKSSVSGELLIKWFLEEFNDF